MKLHHLVLSVVFMSICFSVLLSGAVEGKAERISSSAESAAARRLKESVKAYLDQFISGEDSSVEQQQIDATGPRAGFNRKTSGSAIWSQAKLEESVTEKSKNGSLWKQDGKLFAASEPADDGRIYFVQAYLSGIKPFEATPPQVWQYVYKNFSLQSDLEQFGMEEVYQTSSQTFHRKAGDAEDFSIFVADWLQQLGYDARVVQGTREDKAHTWVILVEDGIEYLIDTVENPELKVTLPVVGKSYRASLAFNSELLWEASDTGWREVGSFIEADNLNQQPGKVKQYRVTHDAPIMLRPDAKARQLGLLRRGEKIQIIKTEGMWHKILYRDGHHGYLQENALQRVL